jgi:hypothetical protein
MPSRLKYVPVGRCIPNGCHREASRILLEITDIRAERLNDISQADAIAEGMPPSHPSFDVISQSMGYPDFSRSAFAQLWQSIYGEKAWSENKWVWVIEFKRILVEARLLSTALPYQRAAAKAGHKDALQNLKGSSL